MLAIRIVGWGIDTLVLNVCYADKQFQPIKQELHTNLQDELLILHEEALTNESSEEDASLRCLYKGQEEDRHQCPLPKPYALLRYS
jgi:hypothetical protein